MGFVVCQVSSHCLEQQAWILEGECVCVSFSKRRCGPDYPMKPPKVSERRLHLSDRFSRVGEGGRGERSKEVRWIVF